MNRFLDVAALSTDLATFVGGGGLPAVAVLFVKVL